MVWKPHTTVAAIIQRDNKFLMVEEIIQGEQVINLPASHLDPNDSLVEAVICKTRDQLMQQQHKLHSPMVINRLNQRYPG